MSESKLRSRTFCYSLAVLLGSFTGCSCQSEDASMVNPEAVHQTYSVTYDGGANKTNVNARFRVGGFTGTNLRLTAPAAVKHNTIALQENTFTGAHYAGSGDGFVAEHIFEYTDIAGKVRKNSIRLDTIDFPADLPAQISRAKGLRITFVGEPPTADDTVTLSLHQKAPKLELQDKNASGQAVAGSKEITITADSLKEFAEGEATIVLTRSRNGQLQDATSRGGSISAMYSTARRKVTIIN